MEPTPIRRRIGIGDLRCRLGDPDPCTIWRWYRAGKFPAPHYLGSRRFWFLNEIEAWEREQMARSATERRSNLMAVRAAVKP